MNCLFDRTVPTKVRPFFRRLSARTRFVRSLSHVMFLPLLKKGAASSKAMLRPRLTCLCQVRDAEEREIVICIGHPKNVFPVPIGFRRQILEETAPAPKGHELLINCKQRARDAAPTQGFMNSPQSSLNGANASFALLAASDFFIETQTRLETDSFPAHARPDDATIWCPRCSWLTAYSTF